LGMSGSRHWFPSLVVLIAGRRWPECKQNIK
jgi:hypothetical protein